MINNKDIDIPSKTYKKVLKSNPAKAPENFHYTDRGDCVGNWLEKELGKLKKQPKHL